MFRREFDGPSAEVGRHGLESLPKPSCCFDGEGDAIESAAGQGGESGGVFVDRHRREGLEGVEGATEGAGILSGVEEGRRSSAATVDYAFICRPVEGGRNLGDCFVWDGEEDEAAAVDDGLSVSFGVAAGDEAGKALSGCLGTAGDGFNFPSGGGEGDSER